MLGPAFKIVLSYNGIIIQIYALIIEVLFYVDSRGQWIEDNYTYGGMPPFNGVFGGLQHISKQGAER
ncbi:hypothetical protein YWY31_42380 [Paenibacillus illinoisensis]